MSAEPSGPESWKTEQLLYFSFPGQVLLIFLALWFFFDNRLIVDTASVAAAALASVPIGFLLYQAYTSDVLYVYHFIWRGREKRAA